MLEREKDKPKHLDADGDVKMNGIGPTHNANGVGLLLSDDEDDDFGWEGGSHADRLQLARSLDECLTIGY